MNFSKYTPGLPNAAAASFCVISIPFTRSSSVRATRIPLPPPPAVALMITG